MALTNSKKLLCLTAGLILTLAVPGYVHAQNPVTYIYDDLGRLAGVVDPSGNAAVYAYDAVGNLLSISRYTSTQVTIIQFTPKIGPAGTTVTIYGTGFSTTASQNTVNFNGTSATVTSATANQIVTSVPSLATTGSISVTSPNGSATSSVSFTVAAGVLGAPTITSFTPTVGSVGTAVSITGTNFDTTPPNNKLKFHRTPPVVSAATSTSLSTSVPAGATSGRISIVNPGGSGVSAADFFVPPSPYTAADVVFTGRVAVSGNLPVTIGTASKIGLVVFDGTLGQRVSFKMTDVTIGFSDVYVYNPDGSTLASASSVGTGGAFIDTKVLPTTGTYTILIAPRPTYTGNMRVNVYNVVDQTYSWAVDSSQNIVSISTPGQRAIGTFIVAANQQISMTMSSVMISDAYFTISDPNGNVFVSPTGIYNGYFLDQRTLAIPGTYSVQIYSFSGSTGTMTVAVHNAQDVTGTITPGGPPVTANLAIPGQRGRLTFTGSANQRVSLKIDNVTFNNCSVSILKPDGSTLASIAVGAGYTWFIDTQTLPTNGTYTIFLNPAYEPQTGSLQLTLYDVPPDGAGTITIGGPAVPVTITTPGQRYRLTFSGNVNQKVSLQAASSATFSGSMTILRPDGTTLATGSFSSGGGGFIDATVLPVDGTTYTIVIAPSAYSTGNVTLTLYNVVDVTGTIMPGGPPVTANLAIPGQRGRLTFTGSANQRVSLKIDNVTFSNCGVSILNPDGSTLASIGVGQGYTWFIDTQTLPTNGTYTIFLNPAYEPQTGSLQLTLYNVVDGTGSLTINGAAVPVNIGTPGQDVRLTFTGSASQQVTVRVTGNSMNSGITVSLRKSDGSLVDPTSTIFSGSPNFNVPQQTLPTNGTYTVLVQHNSFYTGTLSVQVTSP